MICDSLAVKELRRVETFDLAVSHKAGALGITSYEDKNGIEYYVMIVAHLDGENTVYHVYRALASNGIENAGSPKLEVLNLIRTFKVLA